MTTSSAFTKNRWLGGFYWQTKMKLYSPSEFTTLLYNDSNSFFDKWLLNSETIDSTSDYMFKACNDIWVQFLLITAEHYLWDYDIRAKLIFKWRPEVAISSKKLENDLVRNSLMQSSKMRKRWGINNPCYAYIFCSLIRDFII